MNEFLKSIAEKCVGSKKLTVKQILELPLVHASCKIQIFNNKIYTSTHITEERNIQILRQLEEVLKNYSLPNVIFVYNTMDQYSYTNWTHPIFTHAKINNSPDCNHILAPCFSFDFLYKVKEKIPYEITFANIKKASSQYMESLGSWNKKESKITFIGALYKDREINSQFSNSPDVDTLIVNQSYFDKKYSEMSELSKYKYLLNLNGCGGGWSVRLKHLFMCGSLVFYITQFHVIEPHINHLLIIPEMEKYFIKYDIDKKCPVFNLYNIEYWMCVDDFEENLVIVNNTDDCRDKLDYYSKNPEKAYLKSKKAYEYVNTVLSKENVILYWKLLLETYSSRFEESADTLIFNVPFVNTIDEVV